jgi:hypothetical protein
MTVYFAVGGIIQSEFLSLNKDCNKALTATFAQLWRYACCLQQSLNSLLLFYSLVWVNTWHMKKMPYLSVLLGGKEWDMAFGSKNVPFTLVWNSIYHRMITLAIAW